MDKSGRFFHDQTTGLSVFILFKKQINEDSHVDGLNSMWQSKSTLKTVQWPLFTRRTFGSLFSYSDPVSFPSCLCCIFCYPSKSLQSSQHVVLKGWHLFKSGHAVPHIINKPIKQTMNFEIMYHLWKVVAGFALQAGTRCVRYFCPPFNLMNLGFDFHHWAAWEGASQLLVPFQGCFFLSSKLWRYLVHSACSRIEELRVFRTCFSSHFTSC